MSGQAREGLFGMEPLTLDLTHFYWRRWHVSQPCSRRAYRVSNAPHMAVSRLRSEHLPAPRQRMAAARVSRRWLLVVGGNSGEVWEALEGSVGRTLLCTPPVCPRSHLDNRTPTPSSTASCFWLSPAAPCAISPCIRLHNIWRLKYEGIVARSQTRRFKQPCPFCCRAES